MCIGASVAELVSAYPVRLALSTLTLDLRRNVLHHQGNFPDGRRVDNEYLAPPKHVPVVAWFTGWLNLLGQAATTASTDFACG
jgi:hypothetical protein